MSQNVSVGACDQDLFHKVGNTMVMIRPNKPGQAPEAGWTQIGTDGILWRR